MKIFSSYIDDNYEHMVYQIFGVKFKFKNHHRDLYKDCNNLKKFINYLVDADNLPAAKGQLREIQLTVLEIMKLLDSICKKYNIAYWLDFGSLLGAARHKGFIPWDDDIDICIIREEYERLIKVLKKELIGSPYYLRERWEYANEFQARIILLKNPQIGLDIFPVDKYIQENYSQDINTLIYKKFEIAKTKFDKKWNKKELSAEEIKLAKNDIKIFMEKENLTSNNNTFKKPVLFYGIDYPHKWKYKSFEWDTIFPLSTLEFENCTFPVPNKYVEHLTGIYGNWHELPKSLDNIDYFWKEY